jgi:CRISPR-associated protein Csy2
MSLSLQPIASSNIGVSIILEINGLRSIDGVSKFLYSARFSGGSITSTGAPRLFEDFDDAFSAILSGFVVIDRRDLLATKDGKDPAELFVDALGRSENSQSDNTWLSGACVGYACLSPFETRIAAREGYKHAFVEPLIGLVQYKSLRSIAKPGELLLWEPEWSDAGVFRVYQR